MKRVLNIIGRAIKEFDMDVDMNDSLQKIYDQAQSTIEDEVEFDYISECERSRHWDHLSWSDGKGFGIEADGEFISGDDKLNKYYRYEDGEYCEIAWYDHMDDDYVMMHDVIDSDGKKVRLVAK